jgi:hypothetical protein
MRLAIPGRGSRRSAGAAAVVTGAGSGSGIGFAIEIARRSGRVVCADKGRLHVVPQLDAKVIWQAKRLVPATYTRTLGVVERLAR